MMENDTSPRSDQERDIRKAIDDLTDSIANRNLRTEPLTTSEILLFLGHVVSILGSEWGTMMRMLSVLEKQQSLIMNPHGENGFTLEGLYQQAARRGKIQAAIFATVIGLFLAQGWNIIITHGEERSAEKKRDLMIEQQQKMLELLVERKR